MNELKKILLKDFQSAQLIEKDRWKDNKEQIWFKWLMLWFWILTNNKVKICLLGFKDKSEPENRFSTKREGTLLTKKDDVSKFSTRQMDISNKTEQFLSASRNKWTWTAWKAIDAILCKYERRRKKSKVTVMLWSPPHHRTLFRN